MSARNRIRHGFTLVEILIVVVILGILAAIVIPQFTSASETAKASSLVSQLQTIRSQLELYQVQHNGNYPTLAQLNADWGVMTGRTDVDGAIGTTAGTHVYGPYLQKPPSNPFLTTTGGVNIDLTDISGGDAYAATGWGYNANTGAIKAMLPNTVSPTDLGLTDNSDIIAQASGS